MSSLDNIIQKILEDAETEKDKILQLAASEKEELTNEIISQAKEEEETIIAKANNRAQQLVSMATSSAKLSSRDKVLAAKQEVMERVLNQVVEELNQLDNNQYLAYLEKTLKAMNVSKKDEVRVQKDKLDFVHNARLDYNISEESVESGFSVLQENVLLNNDFRSLVDARKDELEAQIVEALFQD